VPRKGVAFRSGDRASGGRDLPSALQRVLHAIPKSSDWPAEASDAPAADSPVSPQRLRAAFSSAASTAAVLLGSGAQRPESPNPGPWLSRAGRLWPDVFREGATCHGITKLSARRASENVKPRSAFGHVRKPSRMFRAGLSARVSTNDQQTVPLQIRALREYAARRDWTISRKSVR
jgi:hypothetical protein